MIPTATRYANLPRLLSLLPKDGLNAVVFQSRWAGKGLPTPSPSASSAINDATCRWEVKKVRLAFRETENDKAQVAAKAWGVLYWKGALALSFRGTTELIRLGYAGKRVTPAEKEYEPIKGGLKYEWSALNTPPLLVRAPKAAEVEKAEA